MYLRPRIFQKSIGEVNKITLFTGDGHGLVGGRVRVDAADSPVGRGRLRQRTTRPGGSR